MVKTMTASCGCVFEAEGEMRMVSYCPGCEAALKGMQKVPCSSCDAEFECEEELEDHFVTEHLGYVRRPLTFVLPGEAA